MSFYLPTTLRLLKTYRDGIAAQLAVLSQQDFRDSRFVSKESASIEDTDYRKVKRALNNVNNEIQIIESL
tara:strand:+ start:317 stop:526 length:210 start_codon:yes stop_codon:yes gene_type:complete